MKTYPIFLASSYELQPERKDIEIFIGRQNKRLVKKNVMLELELWEDMGAELNNGRKQDDYNKVLNKAEIVVVLFWNKMGKYTLEEFELAYQRFLDTGRPLVYVYEKTVSPSNGAEGWETDSKTEFKKRLLTENKEQFHCTFDHYALLESHFLQTLHDLFDKNELTFGKLAERHSLKAPFPPSLVIGREKELESISEKFKNKGQVILVSAEGGMGKTTLASKYWQENRYTYLHCAYLFCETGILKAMTDDGLGLELQGLDDGEKIRQLQRKLSGIADDFLLFLDNANNAEDIVEFLKVFRGYNWNVLITSRSRGVLVNKADEINLSHLDPEDARALFQTFYSEDSREFDVLLDRLLRGLSYHTLLVEVFAKNLKEASEMGTDLKIFLENLEGKGLYLDRDDNFEINTVYPGSIQQEAATVNDILEILYDFSKLTEEERYMLVNLALLPPENYTLQFLLELFGPGDSRAFRDTLKGLFGKGWVGGTDKQYRLSPVIQQSVIHKNQKTLWEDGKQLVQKITSLIKYENKDNAYTKFRWIPYGRQIARIFKNREEEDVVSFLNDLGVLLRHLGGKENLQEAKTHLEKSLVSDLANLGEDAPSVATTRSNLALVLRDLGGKRNLLEAKALLEKSLAFGLAYVGENSPSVAQSRSNLALVLRDLGGVVNLLEAKAKLEKSLASGLANFGENATTVSTIRSNMATVLMDLGGERNLMEAKTQLEKSLASDLANFGEDAPSVSISRSNLGLVLRDLGGERNLLEAKALLEKSLASGLANFGEDAPSVAISHSNLALVLKNLGGEGHLLEAKTHMEKSLASDLANFGEGSPSVAIRRSNLALVLKNTGGEANLKAALALLEISLASDLRNFDEDSPSVARSCSNLALVLRDLGGENNLLEARAHLEKSLASGIVNFGEDAPSVVTSRSNLAMVLRDLGGVRNLLEAKAHLEKSLASDLANFREDSPSAATSRSNLALVLRDLGGEMNLLEAKVLLEKSLASGLANLGEDASSVVGSRSNLAIVLRDLGGEMNLLEAKILLEKSLTSGLANFGEGSASGALISYNLATVLAEIGTRSDLKEAKKLLESSKAIYLRHFGGDYPMVHDVQSWLDNVDRKLEEPED